jgi:hypothetical protein
MIAALGTTFAGIDGAEALGTAFLVLLFVYFTWFHGGDDEKDR